MRTRRQSCTLLLAGCGLGAFALWARETKATIGFALAFFVMLAGLANAAMIRPTSVTASGSSAPTYNKGFAIDNSGLSDPVNRVMRLHRPQPTRRVLIPPTTHFY